MAKLEEKNVLDYRMGGDTVDDFAQKYMAEMTRIYQFLNNLREHNSTGTEQVEPVSYQIKVEDDKIYIRNFANDAWIYLMAVASHGGFRSDTFGKLAYGSASDKPTSGVSTGDTYWGDDGRVYRYNGEKWSLLLSLNVADLTGYDTLITKNDVTTPTDTTTIYKEPQKIPRTNDNGVLPFDISGNAGSIAGVKNEVNNLQDGEVLTYRTVSNSWRNEPKGAVGAGKSFVLKDGDKVIADYSGDVYTETDIGLTAHNDNANGKSHPNQLRPPLKRSTEYAVGDIVFHDSLPSWAYLECVTSGTTATIIPAALIGAVEGDIITDGTLVWKINKIGKAVDITIATEETDGFMSAADKKKLDSIIFSPTGSIVAKSNLLGIKIDKRNSDPNTRCEYIFGAKGMGPCGMDFTNGVFDYGDWRDLWFVKNNKPCMLKSDGTVDYYLDPNDYTKKEDGTASDIANTAYDGNAMAEIPTVWVKRWQDGRYEYEVICDYQYDETYHAYAHTRADGTIADAFYFSMFGGSGNASKIRSLSGQTVSRNLTTNEQIAGATANGSGWYIHSWAQRELIRTLCLIMGCSTDTQNVFGYGNCRSATDVSGILATGTLKDKGQFYGYNNANQMKVFHIEEFWGNQWDKTAGLINDKGKIYVKMTPEGNGYRVTDVAGYTDTGLTAPAGSASYINGMHCDEYGIIPSLATGSSTTYYCDSYWANNGQFNYLIAGTGADVASALGGAFTFHTATMPSQAGWTVGCGLSYI